MIKTQVKKIAWSYNFQLFISNNSRGPLSNIDTTRIYSNNLYFNTQQLFISNIFNIDRSVAPKGLVLKLTLSNK